LRILDKYILKKYVSSFLFTLVILIPIAIAIDIAGKVDKFLRNTELTVLEIIRDYYLNFTLYYANTFMPLALFIAVIFFTSKLSKNTEIIAINSASISFTRFLKPYIIGATMVTLFALVMNHFVVPRGNKVLADFERKYMSDTTKVENVVKEFRMKLGDGQYVFIRSFSLKENKGLDFSYEEYDGLKLKYRIVGDSIIWSKKENKFKLKGIKKRRLYKGNDSIIVKESLDTVFNFSPKDLSIVDYLAKEMVSDKLYEFVKGSEKRGVKNLNAYYVELYKRTSLPISSYILTIIAVCLAFRKKRGGLGGNLAIGIGLMFLYVFLMKITEVLGAVADNNAIVLVWLPNLFFGILAYYLYIKSKK